MTRAAAAPPIFRRKRRDSRICALIVAGALFLHAVLAATPALAHDRAPDSACAAQPASNAERGSLPHGDRSDGTCCVLQCGALDAPHCALPPLHGVAPRAHPFALSPPVTAQPRRPAAKGAPQSPRPPPV